MRAWLMDSYEGVERLRLGEIVDLQPGLEQVLLRVRFAALNPADAFLAQAMYPARPPLPHILGRDGVGDCQLQDGVSSWGIYRAIRESLRGTLSTCFTDPSGTPRTKRRKTLRRSRNR